jgi:CRP-like cAMP-binding protein
MNILRLFENAADAMNCPAGHEIFRTGDEGHEMYVVLDGEVELQRDGRRLNVVGPGSLLGEMALIGNHRRSATAVALTECRLVPVNERRFTYLVQQTPFFALHVMKVLADRVLQKEGGVP